MFQSGELNEGHSVGQFDCGKPELDAWLRTEARRAAAGGTAKVYVWTEAASPEVVACFAICPTEVVRAQDGLTRGQAGGYSRIPGFLLAKLAIDRSLQGSGVGAQVLRDASERIIAAARISGGRLIVVDAIDDDAARFYEHFGFRRVAKRSDRLVMKVASAADALSARG